MCQVVKFHKVHFLKPNKSSIHPLLSESQPPLSFFLRTSRCGLQCSYPSIHPSTFFQKVDSIICSPSGKMVSLLFPCFQVIQKSQWSGHTQGTPLKCPGASSAEKTEKNQQTNPHQPKKKTGKDTHTKTLSSQRFWNVWSWRMFLF